MSALIWNVPPRDSAFIRKAHPEYANSWTTSEMLLADVGNSLRNANWQRSGGKGQKPKLHMPPGSKPDSETGIGDKSFTAEEFKRRMYGTGSAWEPETSEEVSDGS